MNCASYIDNVIHHSSSTKEVMSELNDQLTYDLQDIDGTLTTLQDELQTFTNAGLLIHKEYETAARQSNELGALNAMKDDAEKEIFMAAHRFADSA